MKTLVEMFIFSLSKGLIKIVKWSADLLSPFSGIYSFISSFQLCFNQFVSKICRVGAMK